MLTTNQLALSEWVAQVAALTQPERIEWCDGSAEEYDRLCQLLVDAGTFVSLAEAKRPRSYWASSDPDDVARVESRTFICSEREEDAGPTNNWRDPSEMRAELTKHLEGSMRGRTMYVVPFSMGPIASPASMLGVEVTDSPYVAVSMRIMTRMGEAARAAIEERGSFVPCLHSVGAPLGPGEEDVPWPCDPEHVAIAHFPETREIWSYGSGYGGNALLGKKCLALRIASVIARDEGWLAEHMLIIKVTAPSGEVRYLTGAFPSACGKTNLAMVIPTLPGWKVETIGDDICWMRVAEDGMLRAINPEHGFFGVAPGTGPTTNPNALKMLGHDTIFTNTARTEDGDVWWEGLTSEPPEGLIDWQGRAWQEGSGPAAHPNSRFTVPIAQDPAIAPEWEDPAGVPISGILFGGRRQSVIPLVHEAFDWEHGVFLGSIMSSETTAAATGAVGALRRDPFAMLPFCGYNMGDYWGHWFDVGAAMATENRPRIFYVNWFRKGPDGRFLWPGFGENSRVLAWIFERCAGRGAARETPIGLVPADGALEVSGLDLSPETLAQLLEVDPKAWLEEIPAIRDYFSSFGEHLPKALRAAVEALEARLEASRA